MIARGLIGGYHRVIVVWVVDVVTFVSTINEKCTTLAKLTVIYTNRIENPTFDILHMGLKAYDGPFEERYSLL